MRAGYLNKRITIQQLTDERDETGGVVNTWTEVCKAWASIEPLKGAEFLSAKEVDAQVTTRIRMRQRKDVTITSDMRVVYGSRIFEIDSVIDVYTRGRELQLMSRELVG